MSMKRNHEGNRVPYHRCMDYLFRPKEMDAVSVYDYFRECSIKRKKEIESLGLESFSLLEEHPLCHAMQVVYREIDAVPCFAWNWLPTTKGFQSSILDPADSTAVDFQSKELYAQRFLMLFIPFRRLEDLMENNSYLSKLQSLYHNGEIGEFTTNIADKILNIRNSLDSTMVPNWLTEGTEMPDFDSEDCTELPKTSDDLQKMLEQIGNMLAPMSDVQQLQEEPIEINPKNFQDPKKLQKEEMEDPVAFSEMNDVFDLTLESQQGSVGIQMMPKTRFATKISTLNALVMTRFLTPKENVQRPPGDKCQMGDDWHVEANGTWESIVSWGRINNLDAEQQTAFEILAATYVLSFYEEANVDEAFSRQLKDQQKALRAFARKNQSQTGPLRMFITGPAGAGKCKFLHSKEYFKSPEILYSTGDLVYSQVSQISGEIIYYLSVFVSFFFCTFFSQPLFLKHLKHTAGHSVNS